MPDAPPAPAEGLDPLGAAIARVDLEEVAGRRAARAAAAADGGMSDIAAARAIFRVIDMAAQRLGITEGDGFDDICRRIMAAAPGRLDRETYRAVWHLWTALAPCTEAIPTAAPR